MGWAVFLSATGVGEENRTLPPRRHPLYFPATARLSSARPCSASLTNRLALGVHREVIRRAAFLCPSSSSGSKSGLERSAQTRGRGSGVGETTHSRGRNSARESEAHPKRLMRNLGRKKRYGVTRLFIISPRGDRGTWVDGKGPAAQNNTPVSTYTTETFFLSTFLSFFSCVFFFLSF